MKIRVIRWHACLLIGALLIVAVPGSVQAVVKYPDQVEGLVPPPGAGSAQRQKSSQPEGLSEEEWQDIQSQVAAQVEPEAYIKASHPDIGDVFGYSVAISGDTLVVGAEQEDSAAVGVNGSEISEGAAESGAAYVFVRTESGWQQQAYLKASNTDAGDWFGHSVSVSGDTIVVSAPHEASNAKGVNGAQDNNSALDSGAAYVFYRTGTTWAQQAYLKASNTAQSNFFGWSVGVSGDLVVVGAYFESSDAVGVDGDSTNSGATYSGAAFVFGRSGSAWSQQAYLKASNTGWFDYFGESVAISGNTVVVGAVGEDSNTTGVNGDQANNTASNAGAAYVFVKVGSVWSQQAYLKASSVDAVGGDSFGKSVAVSGDTLVVGAYLEDSGATGVNGDQADNSCFQAGAAYVFARADGTWTQQAYLKASSSGESDQFGSSVSASDDRVVVGAEFEDSNAVGVNGDDSNNASYQAGAAYLFTRTGGDWVQEAYLKATNAEAGDQYGNATAISAGTVVVGAFLEDSGASGVNGEQNNNVLTYSGAAYTYNIEDRLHLFLPVFMR